MRNLDIESLKVGMVARHSYQFTAERVGVFAQLVDDHAPVHTDEAFAKLQGFKGRIVHGLFVQSVISGILGNTLPGTRSIINNITLKMHNPVFIEETVEYQLEVTAISPAVSAVTLSFSGSTSEGLVMSGKALCTIRR